MTLQEFKNSLTLPLITSPMFIVSKTELVVEACKNGICGTFPSLNGRSPEDFEQMLQTITTQLKQFEEETGKKAAPFGVNLIVNRTNPRLEIDLKLCIKYQVPLIITSLGAVKELVDAVHNYGGLVFHDVIKKRHAEKAAEAGVDGIIAVAAGAGGHAGTANPFALIDDIRSFYDGCLILAGALNNGHDILAAQTMGADFAYMGTRFIATKEGAAENAYKEMLVNSTFEDVLYTDGISGVNANFLKPSILHSGIDLNEKKEEDFSNLIGGDGHKAWKDIWSAGHGVSGIHDIPTTEELINQMKAEYKTALTQHVQILKDLNY